MRKIVLFILIVFCLVGCAKSTKEEEEITDENFDDIEMSMTDVNQLQCFKDEESDYDEFHTNSYRVWIFQDIKTNKIVRASDTYYAYYKLDLTDEEKQDLNKLANEEYCTDYDKDEFDSCVVLMEEGSFDKEYIVRVKYTHKVKKLNSDWKANKDTLSEMKENLEGKGYECSLFMYGQ